MSKVVDCFIYFNEKELFELRINLLKDHVDHFIVAESNQTHSGKPRQFQCKKLIEEYNLPKDKITVIEVMYPSESFMHPEQIDVINSSSSESSNEVSAWSRERIQRDAMNRYIESYDDKTVFIVSDCDEILDPTKVQFLTNFVREHNIIVKIPLALLEGNANQRVYDGDKPVPWDMSLFICTKQHLSQVTPTNIRSGVGNIFGVNWLTQNGANIEDCGWHFTWMGDSERRKVKAESFIHYANMSMVNTLSYNSMKEMHTNNKKYDNYILRDYPNSNLPQIIFELDRVKNFLIKEK